LRNGVKKSPQLLLFSMAKGGPSAQWISLQLSKIDGIMGSWKIGGALIL
jgi:hypothetical protein